MKLRRVPVAGPVASPLIALLVAFGAVAAIVLAAAPAQAHDVLLSTSPADGSTVAHVPPTVVLTFDAAAFAVGTQILVNGPDGSISAGKPVLVNHTVTQPLAGGSPAGHYTVLWRVTSADGHPVSGMFAFTATGASLAAAAPTTAPATTATHHSGGGPLPWVAGAVVVVAIWVGVLVLVRRRRPA